MRRKSPQNNWGKVLEKVNWKPQGPNEITEAWSDEVPPLVQRWMQTRGFQSYEDFDEFLSFRLKDLTNPAELKDLDKAVSRLIEAFKQDQKLCIYADFDMDGTPGLALLLKGLKLCGFKNLFSFQPDRFDHGYGVHPYIIEQFIDEQSIDLFVTVDVGITDVKAVAAAQAKSVDFIITDHHQPKEELPQAVAIVNPNQKDCTSGLGYLCGTGVAFYLLLGLRAEMKKQGLLAKDFDPKSLLDCFAIATLTDMVPLLKENRVLVQHGLLELQRTKRVGLKLLMQEVGIAGKTLASQDVSIRLAPKLNALSRMKSDVQPIDLFLVNDTVEAQNMVEQVMAAQALRVEVQKKGQDVIEGFLQGKESFKHLFCWSEDFHKGVVGLIATKCLNRYKTPTYVGAILGDKIVGSGRAPDGKNLLPALEYAKEALVRFGGHKQAAGFELKLEKAEEFAALLQEFYDREEQEAEELCIEYDVDGDLKEIDKNFLTWLKKLEPFGQNFSSPIFRLNHLFVASTRVLKEQHLKFVLKNVAGDSIDALWFFPERLEELRGLTSKRVSILAEPSVNQYMGTERLQLFIKDLQIEF